MCVSVCNYSNEGQATHKPPHHLLSLCWRGKKSTLAPEPLWAEICAVVGKPCAGLSQVPPNQTN